MARLAAGLDETGMVDIMFVLRGLIEAGRTGDEACDQLARGLMERAEAGLAAKAPVDSLLAWDLLAGSRPVLEYARALALDDSAGLCDSLLAVARRSGRAAIEARCAAVCLSRSDDGRARYAGEVAPYVDRMLKSLSMDERLALARLLIGTGLEPRALREIAAIRAGLRAGYGDAGLVEIGAAYAAAGERERADSIYLEAAGSPVPSEYTLDASRRAFLLRYMTPPEVDIATEVEQVVAAGATSVDLGDLFMDKLHDFERAANFYRRGIEVPPEGSVRERTELKLAKALTLEWMVARDEALREEALGIVAEVATEDTLRPREILDALLVASDWLEADREQTFEILKTLGARPDAGAADLYRIARLLYQVFTGKEGNIYAECVITLNRLTREFASSPEAPLGSFLLGRMKYDVGDYAGAREIYQVCIDTWKRSPVIGLCQRGIAECYLGSGGLEDAVTHFRLAGESPELDYLIGCCLELEGDRGSARAHYERALQVFSTPPVADGARLRLALILIDEGERETALARLDSPLPEVRGRLAPHRQVAVAYLAGLEGYGRNAMEALRDLGSDAPPEVLCRARHAAGGLARDYEGASTSDRLADAEDLCTSPSDAYEWERARARHACSGGSSDECRKARGRFSKRYPLDRKTRSELALLRSLLAWEDQRSDSLRAEIDSLLEAAGNHPVGASVRYRVGLDLLVDKSHREAITYFSQIVERYPESDLYHDACFKLGTAYYMAEAFDSSALYFGCASDSRKPEVAENALFNHALTLEESGEYERAAEAFGKIALRFPFGRRFERALMRSAYALEQSGRHREAIPVYRGLLQYVDSPEAQSEAMYWIGESLAELGRHREAAAEFLRVGFTHPDVEAWAGTAWYRAGAECEKAGLADHAVVIYRKTVERFGEGSNWGKASQDRLTDMLPEQ
jgi:TolA-binding protein